ncbi:5233_t:CDS:2 [Diversispora eburnea]|uniref:5233_t:CDS:1 n=1 Tax=Diversispora eburnea TaxID=1213867 RepID=A0A9N9FML6_9GLOM|nr:5233_t:CDS:2 [Diversispora eburnea]
MYNKENYLRGVHIRQVQFSSYKRRKTTTKSRGKGKGRAFPVGPASTPINSPDLPIAMRMPQEILNTIFNNLVDHPVHFTRVAQVCKSWQLASDTHLYWMYLVKKLNLNPPKPRAKKFKTFKQVVERDWGTFCSLCFRGSGNGHGRLYVRPAVIDLVTIAEIYKELKTTWFKIFEDNNEFQVSFDRELREVEISHNEEAFKLTNNLREEQNDSVIEIDKDQFYREVSVSRSTVPTLTSLTQSSSSTSSSSATITPPQQSSSVISQSSSSSSSSSSAPSSSQPFSSVTSRPCPENAFITPSSDPFMLSSPQSILFGLPTDNNFLSTDLYPPINNDFPF